MEVVDPVALKSVPLNMEGDLTADALNFIDRTPAVTGVSIFTFPAIGSLLIPFGGSAWEIIIARWKFKTPEWFVYKLMYITWTLVIKKIY